MLGQVRDHHRPARRMPFQVEGHQRSDRPRIRELQD